MRNIKPIHTEKDYNQALTRIDEIFDAKPGTIHADELEILSLLVDNYEEEHFPIDLPDPIEVLRFKMDQLGLKQKDLVKTIGFKGRVSDILSKKRKLSLPMIRRISSKLSIPASLLVKEY